MLDRFGEFPQIVGHRATLPRNWRPGAVQVPGGGATLHKQGEEDSSKTQTDGDEIAMDLFNGLFLTLECPKCNYGMDVELLSVRLEATIFCPCCKVTVQLVDADASVHRSKNEIEAELKGFEGHLKKLNRTIRFKI